jgi:hypothetical protein
LIVFGESSAGASCGRAARVLGFTLSGLLWSSSLLALEYDYDAPDSCPNGEVFLSEVRSRLRYPAEQSTVERLQVTVRRQQGYEASFVLIEPGQPPVSRTLTAAACEEVVQALALGAALALDARYREVQGIPEGAQEAPAPSVMPLPVASAAFPAPAPATAPVPAPAAVPVPAPAAVPVPEPAAVASPVPAVAPSPMLPASAVQPTPAAPPAGGVGIDAPPPDPPAPAPDPLAPALAARLGAFGATGYAPDPSFGPSLAAVARISRFALELEGFYATENRAGNGEQSAEFWVVGGRLSPCVRWPLPGRFWVKGCGVVEFSGVHAEGVPGADVASTAEDLVPYWALGAVAGTEAPLTQALNLGLDLGVQFPLSERRFYFVNGDEGLHEFPNVAARGQLTICYAF